MIVSREEVMERVKQLLGEKDDDESLKAVEDITDTIKDLEEKQNDSTDWKAKYEENDSQWRQKYKERFFSGEPKAVTPTQPENYPPDVPEEPEVKEKSIDDLFN